MALETVIRQFSSGDPYKMQVLYNAHSNKWILSFTSMSIFVNHEEQHEYDSFGEVMRRYRANCIYYNIPQPSRITEEEFLGLPAGILYRKQEAC